MGKVEGSPRRIQTSGVHALPAIHPVDAVELGATWSPECPVPTTDLFRVEFDHIGFDGQIHRGELIIHQTVVDDVVAIVEQLYGLGYPINKARNVAHYQGASDELSMQDNNTSAFNARRIPGSDSWSWHAHGLAVDLNPLINPCIGSSGIVEPKTGWCYLDRSRTDPGLLHPGDPAVLAFTERGWTWGGDWNDPLDYQHFERPT